MRHVLLIFLLAQSISSYSQFFVGDSKEYTKAILEKNEIVFSEAVLTDTTSRISWIVENAFQMILVLNNEDIVIRQTLLPDGENGVNEFVKWFNKDFVIISDAEWRTYENGRIYKIKLEHLYGEPYFSITLSPDSR